MPGQEVVSTAPVEITVSKIRLITTDYEYEWTDVPDSFPSGGLYPSDIFTWTGLYPGQKISLKNFEREVVRTERRLVDSGLFYTASVHVVPPRRKPFERTVVITVSEGFPHRFSGGNAFVLYGRKALCGKRASVFAYAGWNLFGFEVRHENFGNRRYLLEAEAFSHDFLPSLCSSAEVLPRNDLVVHVGKFLSPDLSVAVGPGLVSVSKAYNRGYSFHPFGEVVVRVSRFVFAPIEAAWTLDSCAAWFPFDEMGKLSSVASFSTILAEDIFNRGRNESSISLYFTGAGGWTRDEAPNVLAFNLYEPGENTIRSGYTEEECTFFSYAFVSAEFRFDCGEFIFHPGFSVIPQGFLFTDAAMPSFGKEGRSNVRDAYGVGVRLKFLNPVFTDVAFSWGINHEGNWRCVFFVETKK